MSGELQSSGRIGGVPTHPASEAAVLNILFTISFCHMLNDLVQSLLPAIYPLLQRSYGLDFMRIGLLTLTYQLTASLLQPLVGTYTDRHPKPYSLVIGMGFTLVGLLLLSRAWNFPTLVAAAALTGMGSSVFHPESSRVARAASGGRHGFAQSVFQVGGNFGQALGPLLAAFIVVPHGQRSLSWFSAVVLLAMVLLFGIGRWYRAQAGRATRRRVATTARPPLPHRQVVLGITVLIGLIFSKYFYLASLTNYYTFYLIDRFHLSVQAAQLHLFIFLGAVAAGTIIGGPVGDRIGRKPVIWGSILGVLPFTLMLPYASLFWTGVLTAIIGVILASAFSAIIVFAQELVPGKIGMISGLFFGLAFGMAGVGAAVLGAVADATSIEFVYHICAYLPALGLLAAFLPRIDRAASQPT